MGTGSYRGGSTPVGWNANRYVAPSLTGRTRTGKALIKDLMARTAQSQAEQAELDARARKRHGIAPKSAPRMAAPTAVSAAKSGVADEARKRLKAGGRQAFKVTVVRRRSATAQPTNKPLSR